MELSEVVSTLESTGYRPITLNSYREFISGIRYVAIETLGSEGFKVIQFLPTDHKSGWDVVRWDGADSTSLYVCRSDRTTLDNEAYLRVGYDWFAKVADKVNTTKDYFVGDGWSRNNRGAFFQSLEMFLENSNGGFRNPFDVAYSFERAHPANQTQRQIADLERQRAELAAREAIVRQQENFAQVNELRAMGASCLANNQQELGAAYFREADALARRVQATLDRGEQVVREMIHVTVPQYTPNYGITSTWAHSNWDVYSPTVTRTYLDRGSLFWPTTTVGPFGPSAPKLTTVETVERKPRVIEFEDEPGTED